MNDHGMYGFLLAGVLTIATPAVASTETVPSTSSPLACVPSALGPAERKQHFEEYGPRLRTLVSGARELPTGYEFTFPNDAATYRLLSAWMYQERLCCPFFDFDLTLGREGGALALKLTGREGVKEFIETDFQPWLARAKARS